MSDLVTQISKETMYFRDDVQLVLESAVKYIAKDLHDGKRVMIKNFGVFKPLLTKDRVVVHPATKEKYLLKSHFVPRFTPADKFYEEVAYGGSEGRSEFVEKTV